MDLETERWQSDAARCFEWLAKMYEQAQTLWTDAEAMFQEEGWQTQLGSGFGGIAMSMLDLAKWPFAYFKVMGAFPAQADSIDSAKGVFFGIIFHDKHRLGPYCVAGVAGWSDDKANCDHWLLYNAVNGTRSTTVDGWYENTDGPIHNARITTKGKQRRPGMEDVTWFEVPLGTVNSPERLRDVILAAIGLYSGDDTPARDVASWNNREGEQQEGGLGADVALQRVEPGSQ
jgi:hypothetical protein